MSSAHWDEVWSTREPASTSWFRANLEGSLDRIRRFAPPPDAAIIDVGGGATSIARALVDAKYRDITVLDVSSVALARLVDDIGRDAEALHTICADVCEWSAPTARFDLWHDRAALHFLTDPERRSRYVTSAALAVKPGGHLVIATFAHDGPEKCSGLPVQRYAERDMADLFAPRFSVVESTPETHVTPGGSEQRFMWSVLLRR